LKFIDTHSNPDTECDKLAPDAGGYPIDDQPQGDEFKIADTSDPFSNPEDPLKPQEGDFHFEKDSDNARLFRGQLASYAAAHEGCQFHVHTFCVLVCGQYARFIRWDRDGATVTRRFDYIKEPQLLAGFFWRYAHLDRSQQGYDASVSSATLEYIQQMQHFESRFREDNPSHREFRAIMVPDREDRNAIYRIISSKIHRSLTVRTSHSTHIGFRRGSRRDRLSEGLLESGCGWNDERRRNLRAAGV
jgi:hypothetical protein